MRKILTHLNVISLHMSKRSHNVKGKVSGDVSKKQKKYRKYLFIVVALNKIFIS